MPPLRVLYVLDYTDLGGGETSILNTIAAARSMDQVDPVALIRGPGPVADTLADLGVPTRIVDYPLRLRRGPFPWSWFGFAPTRAFAQVIREFAPAVIHANNFFALLYAARARRQIPHPEFPIVDMVDARGKYIGPQLIPPPIVWTCHGPWDLTPSVKASIARREAAHVTCVSGDVLGLAEQALGRKVSVSLDPPGIPPFDDPTPDAEIRTAVRTELGLSPTAPVIAVVARFQPVKGHDRLLDALPPVFERHPDATVLLIGDALFGDPAETAHKQHILGRIAAAGWSDRIRHLGFRTDARRLLRAADALVIPSDRESFGMTAVEAMEAAIPVVAPDTGGTAETLDPPATGRLYRTGNPKSLTTELLAVLAPKEESAFNPTAGPARVQTHYTAQARLTRLTSIYKQLLDGS